MAENINPYSDAYGISYNEGDFSLERIPYTYTKSPRDIFHTVMEGETLLSISHRYYGDSGYWANIADVNKIHDAIEDIVPGLNLLIPMT